MESHSKPSSYVADLGYISSGKRVKGGFTAKIRKEKFEELKSRIQAGESTAELRKDIKSGTLKRRSFKFSSTSHYQELLKV